MNTFIPARQVAQELLDIIDRETAGMSTEERIGFWYDLQTSFGHFPATSAERDRYIKESLTRQHPAH